MARYVEITPDPKKVARGFIRAGLEMRNLRAPLEQSVRRVVIPSIQENFFEGGRPKWEPLSDETLQRRERQGTGDAVLHESGTGERHALSRARWNIGMREARYPANWPRTSSYMQFHHEGTENMPARPFGVVQDPEDVDAIASELARWVDHQVIARMLGL